MPVPSWNSQQILANSRYGACALYNVYSMVIGQMCSNLGEISKYARWYKKLKKQRSRNGIY